MLFTPGYIWLHLHVDFLNLFEIPWQLAFFILSILCSGVSILNGICGEVEPLQSNIKNNHLVRQLLQGYSAFEGLEPIIRGLVDHVIESCMASLRQIQPHSVSPRSHNCKLTRQAWYHD